MLLKVKPLKAFSSRLWFCMGLQFQLLLASCVSFSWQVKVVLRADVERGSYNKVAIISGGRGTEALWGRRYCVTGRNVAHSMCSFMRNKMFHI